MATHGSDQLAESIATLSLASLFIAAYVWCGVAVGRQSTQDTETGMLLSGLALLAYLTWLYFFGKVSSSISKNHKQQIEATRESSNPNFKRTLVALLLCIPGAFLFIGFLLPPFIVLTSAIALLVNIAQRHRAQSAA